MAHLYLSAAQKSSGKTTLAIGLCRALTDEGLRVQPFKKGPDFIDPLWLGQAAGRPCFNLDYNTMSGEAIQEGFARESAGCDLALIEGNVGLYDSTDLAGTETNAELAKLLGAPVVLVLDCAGMSRGIAPLLLGYRAFDPGVWLAGVVLNKVGGSRHGANLRRAVEHYTDLPVMGILERDRSLAIAERHLGLMPSNETAEAEAWVERIAAHVADQVDLKAFQVLADQARRLPPTAARPPPRAKGRPVRIGLARDSAFGFYYPDDLLAFAQGGAELVEFSPVCDAELPVVDGLFLGGGFPEYRMAELEANRGMRESIADFIARGGPVYAECGGLMYLCQGLTWGGERRAMVGVLKAEVEMRPKPQGRGYVRLRETERFPWPASSRGGSLPSPSEIKAHEFHHSAIVAPHPGWDYAYEVRRGTGIDGHHDGVVQGNLLACYSHLRDINTGWVDRFLSHVRRCRSH
jgi:cobyrinic acid a,c-diamide synthase